MCCTAAPCAEAAGLELAACSNLAEVNFGLGLLNQLHLCLGSFRQTTTVGSAKTVNTLSC